MTSQVSIRWIERCSKYETEQFSFFQFRSSKITGNAAFVVLLLRNWTNLKGYVPCLGHHVFKRLATLGLGARLLSGRRWHRRNKVRLEHLQR